MVELEHLDEVGELDTGTDANQIRTLRCLRVTQWISHFKLACSLMALYSPICLVFSDIAMKGSSFSQQGDAKHALRLLMSFDFTFILYVIKEIMGIIKPLCQAL